MKIGHLVPIQAFHAFCEFVALGIAKSLTPSELQVMDFEAVPKVPRKVRDRFGKICCDVLHGCSIVHHGRIVTECNSEKVRCWDQEECESLEAGSFTHVTMGPDVSGEGFGYAKVK